MKRLTLSLLALALLSFSAAIAQDTAGKKADDKKIDEKKVEPKKAEEKKDDAKKEEPKKDDKQADAKKAAEEKGKLAHTKLAPALLVPNLCAIRYRVSTTSPECQAFVDQGLGFFYSYVFMESARSFETALKHDPNCAMAWWGLSKACEKWGRAAYAPPLKKAQELMAQASPREALLIKARLQEKGIIEGIKQEDRRKEAVKTLDELLTLFEDDEEGWFCRAQVADGPNAAVPFYKALIRVNPLHAGAHHELLHHYENIKRPGLGWQHAVKYMESSPGIPHAFHMQAHLAMRLGKWSHTSDNSAHAIVLQEAYHKLLKVSPGDDHQFAHHIETLMQSLVHDGRFKEANDLKKKSQGYKFEQKINWFRLHLAERDWDAALGIANGHKKDKLLASYLRAVVYLRKGDYDRATPEVNVLKEAYQTRRSERDLELRLWETQGFLMACTGDADAGLKLMAKTVDKTKDDYNRHAWGHGAYHMETWGIAALRAQRPAIAEEAFLEALAHDSGSVRGALGLQLVCERQGRSEEALRFAELAQRCWRRADAGRIPQERAFLSNETPDDTRPTATPAIEPKGGAN